MTAEADHQAASALARMPTELLSKIARPLSTTELCSLRLTCRLIERKLFNGFATEFFRRKQFMMAPQSLQALTDIAHSRLGGYLQRVIIGTDQISNPLWDSTTAADQRRFLDESDGQRLMGHVGCVPLFKKALEKLENLETIDIRDFDSATRFRDGLHAEWKSYGASDLTNFGYISRGNGDWDSSVVQNVLHGAAAAGVRPSSLEVIFRFMGRGILDNSLYLSKPIAVEMRSLLFGLTKLHLDLEAHREHLRHSGFPNLCEFLSQTPNVTWLRLNCSGMLHIESDAEIQGWTDLLDWLAKKQPASSHTIARYTAPPTFQLQKLDLGRARISQTQLLEVVKAYQSLKTLSLQRVILTDPAGSGQTSTRFRSGQVSMAPHLFIQLLEGLDDTSVHTLSVNEVSQLTPVEGIGRVKWRKGEGQHSKSITLRSLPGRFCFKDGIDLMSMDAGTNHHLIALGDNDDDSEDDDDDGIEDEEDVDMDSDDGSDEDE